MLKTIAVTTEEFHFLSIVGKILSRIIFKRIDLHIADNVLPKSQCGFRSGQKTVDMIFTIRQLQGKCQEQCKDLFQVFINLTRPLTQ